MKTKKRPDINQGSWLPAFFLYLYALAFSYAYVTLDTGIGALILFGAVQITMIVTSLLKGKQLIFLEWTGLLLAFAGLSTLLMPGTFAPSLIPIEIMN